MEPGPLEGKFRVPRTPRPHPRAPSTQPEPGFSACPRIGRLTPAPLTPYTFHCHLPPAPTTTLRPLPTPPRGHPPRSSPGCQCKREQEPFL